MKTEEPHILTFGCRLNLYESEVIRAHLVAAGVTNAVVINSCAVTGEAERQLRQTIRKARREHPQARLIVTGCAAQRAPEKYAAMDEVDQVIDNTAKLKAESWEGGIRHPASSIQEESIQHSASGIQGSASVSLGRHSGESRNPVDGSLSSGSIYSGAASLTHPPRMPDAECRMPPLISSFSGNLTRGFVPVQYGCDNACTFCVVPQMRGRARSLPLEMIAAQTRKLVCEAGYPEIALTGVDIASYNDEGRTLGCLVRDLLAAVPELKRLRLSSLDPAAMDEDLWALIAGEPRLMPHLHLSLQAGDDMILKRMKRRHSRADILALVARACALRPDIAIGADIIAGFPTETDEMFENTRALVVETGLCGLHVFPYSARSGTPAAKMPQVPMPVRKERAALLRALGEAALKSHIDGLKGKRLELHVEQPTLGRTPCFTEVVLTAPQKVGTVVQATLTGREQYRATAEV